MHCLHEQGPHTDLQWSDFFYLLRGRKTKGSMVSNIMCTIMKKIDEKKTITLLASAPQRNMKVEVWENRIGVMDGLYC